MSESAFVDLETIFGELEDSSASHGLTYRRIYQSTELDVLVFVRGDPRLRGMTLELKKQLVPLPTIEGVKGLHTTVETKSESVQWLTVEQVRLGDSSLFAIVVSDIARSCRARPNELSRVAAERISKWRSFFTRSADGLSNKQQLGLVGELHVLRRILAPAAGLDVAISTWHGPMSAVHDFSSKDWALEVKATATNRGAVARISSEQQLDPSDMSPLFLAFLAFDVRPFSEGQTLPQLVADIRAAASALDTTQAATQFEDLLIDVGYLDLHQAKYGDHFTLKREEVFGIAEDFPSLRPANLPDEVSHVSYDLNTSLCQPWRVPLAHVTEKLAIGMSNES